MSRVLHFVVPGPLDQRTGGYLYDARMVAELRTRGCSVEVHGLAGAFPQGDPAAAASLGETLAGLPDDALVVLDGLAMGSLPGVLRDEATRLRLVALVHHPLGDETGLGAEERERLFALEREALAAVRGVVVTSPFTAERLRAYGVDPRRVRAVIPGTEPPPSRGAGPTPDGVPLLLSVGTVIPRKGHDILLEALAGLCDVSWRCVCAGSLERDAAFADAVRRRSRELALEARVTFTGELEPEPLEALYAAASVFVLPSHYEGYGMALTEALRHGLPVVSTTGGAIPWTLPHGVGTLVPPGDARALAGALRGLLTDPGERAAYRAAARDHAAALPDWATQGAAFEAALLALADHG
ncbi:MAG TPA: glycosyltransferase family 4 protein [Longimicrobiales bacterium]|nr:glycosyltransferase family 4 protein [Longimicrobiales bacterium]